MTSKGRFAFVLVGTLAFAACADDEDLKDTRPTDGDVSDVVGIDVDTDSGPDDTGTVDMDADVDSTTGDTGTTDTGSGSTDTGTPVTDTGTIVDTGTPVTDTGTIVTDTGSVMLDTGPFDTGTVAMDTGTLDTGPFDTGTVTMDTGPFDTGPFDTGTVTMDTGPFDTGPFDTGTVTMDTGPFDTGPFDTGSVVTETGAPDAPVSDGPSLETAFDETGTSLDGMTKTTFSRSITIDGANDFTPGETFTTTSGGYTAYVTWDSSYVYVGYSGPDVGSGASTNKWVIVHIDGITGSGSTTTEVYGSDAYGKQQHQFPAGFESDLYFAWKTDDTYQQLKTWNGTSWVMDLTPVVVSKSGNYVEMAIPLSPLGARSKLGITSFMLNEGSGPWTYAGLYSDSFIDGYSAVGTPKTIAHWVDASSGLSSPNDPARKK